jgi:thioredoxin-like negative regulator of GroEL
MKSPPSLLRTLVRLAVACALLAPGAASAADDIEALVVAKYPGVLTAFADGHEDHALSELAAFEDEFATASPARLEKLWKAKLHVLRELIDDPEVLVPAIALHHDAYLAYRAEGKSELARHSRVMAAGLAEAYADKSSGPEAKALAARALASLGGYQQEDGSIGSASEHFVEALRLDPTCEAALLGQAAMFEKLGQYDKARDFLERLVAKDKTNPQARLRLALNLLRTKDTARAQQILDGLIQDAGTPATAWVTTLAYEEKARRLVDNGAAKDAADLLRRGSERFPENTEMLVARSYLLERAGDARGALDLAQRAASLAKSAGAHDAPRWLYNRWPREALEAARKSFRDSMTPRLERLSAALHGETVITTVQGQ